MDQAGWDQYAYIKGEPLTEADKTAILHKADQDMEKALQELKDRWNSR